MQKYSLDVLQCPAGLSHSGISVSTTNKTLSLGWTRGISSTDTGHKAPESLKTNKGSAGPLYKDYFHPQKNKKERTGIRGDSNSHCTCRMQDCSVWPNLCVCVVLPLSTCRARGFLEAVQVSQGALPLTHFPSWACATVSV